MLIIRTDQVPQVGHDHLRAGLQVLEVRIKERPHELQGVELSRVFRPVEFRADKFEVDRRNSGDARKRGGLDVGSEVAHFRFDRKLEIGQVSNSINIESLGL